jgi:hypothetical protein
VIYSSNDLKSPAEILKRFGNRCKRCGATLLADSFEVHVEKFEGTLTRPVNKEGDISLSPLPLAKTHAVS